MLVLPHAVTSSASLGFPSRYIKLITDKVDLFSILALLLVFHAITFGTQSFQKNPHNIFDDHMPLSMYASIMLLSSMSASHTWLPPSRGQRGHIVAARRQDSTLLYKTITLQEVKC